MKVVQINQTCGSGSTGKICLAISKLLCDKGVENYILYSMGNSNYPYAIKYANLFFLFLQAVFEKLTGMYGFGSKLSTIRLISLLKKIDPDIVQIHNIHTHDCDLEMLFKYLNRNNKKVYWTFHDCWAFTGYCTHFVIPDCNKWKSQCYNCVLHKQYSPLFDLSRILYTKKKQLLCESNITIISPSNWLCQLVKKSFLSNKEVRIINNGIDLNIFKPVNSDFRDKFNIKNKFLILGIANVWTNEKGLQEFIQLAKDLDNDCQIVLVGTDTKIDRILPANIISIHRTQNQSQLAEIYSASDLFVIPTYEENFPTVNIESLACGTPVLTYNTGGSPEMLDDLTGMVTKKNDYESLKEAILSYKDSQRFKSEDCVRRAHYYSDIIKLREYVELYSLYESNKKI